MKNKKSGPSGYFPDDCWELIFQKLREDDEQNLDSISLVSKRFLSISNRAKLSLNINNDTLPLLPNFLSRFRHNETVVIDTDTHKDINGLLNQISRSGVMNLQAMKFRRCSMTKPPRYGFKALASNKNIKNNLKVLDCSALISMRDNDLLLIADYFPGLEELRVRADCSQGLEKLEITAGCITDDGVEAMASKLKELKEIRFEGDGCLITDPSLIYLSKNCVKLRRISLSLNSYGAPYQVTGDGIGIVTRHSPNWTFLSLKLYSSELSPISFSMGNVFANAKNLHSLTMTRDPTSDKHICFVAKARPPLKKLKLIDFSGEYSEIYGALKMLLQACQLTLEELTLIMWPLTDTVVGDLAQYLSNLTSIYFYEAPGLTSVAFYTLTKSCPLLEILKMRYTGGQEMNLSSLDYLHKNY